MKQHIYSFILNSLYAVGLVVCLGCAAVILLMFPTLADVVAYLGILAVVGIPVWGFAGMFIADLLNKFVDWLRADHSHFAEPYGNN